MFRGIEHIAIASPDPKRLAEWYSKTLGFQIILEDGGTHFIRAGSGGVVEIIRSEGERADADFRTPGMRHIAIQVNDFDAAYARLKELSVTFRGEPFQHGQNRLVFFADADGNLLHLIQRGHPLP